MPKEDLKKIARWMAYVYAPIVLLIAGVFILVEYRAHELEKENADLTSTRAMLHN